MKTTRRAVDGVLLLDKPEGLSSNSAVGWAKRLFNAEKAGHTGTLDPFATGLLPICLGEATKFSRFILDAEKGYRAILQLGEVSSTGDTEGEIIQRRPVDVSAGKIAEVLAAFQGAQTQVPPMHSALKRNGVPLYKLARQGVSVEREARPIVVNDITFVSLTGNELVIDTNVSKGTYIRVLAQDIGEALGCGAHLIGLRRTSTGGFSIANAINFDALEKLTVEQRDALLRPADSLAAALPEVRLTELEAVALRNGQVPQIAQRLLSDTEYRVYGVANDFIGVAQAQTNDESGTCLTVTRLMATGES